MTSLRHTDPSDAPSPAPVEREPSAYVPPAIHWEEEFDAVVAGSKNTGIGFHNVNQCPGP